ncbi:MAG TPA: Clp protease N-terminal domain-containing protein [Gemmatimonadaceae bacterium]|nr:Clp protease N-terminal domain-containing protein [Gemmatimonadaceae bacterium]
MTSVPAQSRPYTTRAQRVLTLADQAAASLDHEYIGAEHLLLGLLEEKTGIAAQILTHLGVTSEAVRRALQAAQGRQS